MRIDAIGYQHHHDPGFIIDRPNGSQSWLLLAVRTKSFFRLDGRIVHANANSIMIFTLEYPQYYGADGEQYIDDWIHFVPTEEEEALIHALGLPLNTLISLPDVTAISGLIREMCGEYFSPNIKRAETIDLYFRILLNKIYEGFTENAVTSFVNEKSYFDHLIWIRSRIYRNPGDDWNIDHLAHRFLLSRSRFQHLYSDTFGIGISKDIIAARMERAAELLKMQDLSINEIAEKVGYSIPSSFNRQFKAAFGQTPSQYRLNFWKDS